MIASMCWLSPDVNEEQLTPQENEQLRSIAETRMLPEGWQFEVVTDIPGVDMEQFRGWFIQLCGSVLRAGMRFTSYVSNCCVNWLLTAIH